MERLDFLVDPAIPHEGLNLLMTKRTDDRWGLHKIMEFNVDGVIPMVTIIWEREWHLGEHSPEEEDDS